MAELLFGLVESQMSVDRRRAAGDYSDRRAVSTKIDVQPGQSKRSVYARARAALTAVLEHAATYGHPLSEIDIGEDPSAVRVELLPSLG